MMGIDKASVRWKRVDSEQQESYSRKERRYVERCGDVWGEAGCCFGVVEV
jgi:hypothetical protein